MTTWLRIARISFELLLCHVYPITVVIGYSKLAQGR